MAHLLNQLMNDEAGFIVSAELVLVSTIAVLAMIVGLSEVALNINNELEDVGAAFGNINQSYKVGGLDGHMGGTYGSKYSDRQDFCDNYCNIVPNGDFSGERP
ncbi:branched-chain amino acid aminotransferase [Planctopirus hydrillae]|uniref:Branched-chain amino acid aminotransferase n=1 Tax=Planctopirus hydrillae TaxID=1841610 RepID=A0A1C3ETE3_9PLAN|nr:branched-chain amino acid aminotransferase [Planctopirus hydrillae]ODA36506.1 branched-chain amino acid aminotransferase [Planctopirus hydrillae]